MVWCPAMIGLNAHQVVYEISSKYVRWVLLDLWQNKCRISLYFCKICTIFQNQKRDVFIFRACMRLSWHIRMKSKREWQNFFLPNLFPRALFNVFVESEWPAPGLSSSRWCGSPTFSPLFHHLFVDGHCWPAEGGVGVFLIIIDVTGITVNVVIILGSKPPQTLGYILYIHTHTRCVLYF